MIGSFRHKALEQLWVTGRSARIDAKLHGRIIVRLDRLDIVADVGGMNMPGFNFHALRGFNPTRYSVHINGPWCITFAFVDGQAEAVDFEQYH